MSHVLPSTLDLAASLLSGLKLPILSGPQSLVQNKDAELLLDIIMRMFCIAHFRVTIMKNLF